MTIIRCQTCGARNRVGPIDRGVPRCAKCKSDLAWLVGADGDTFAAETTVVIRDGHEVDRIVGALPRAGLEQRLAPVLTA